MILKPLSQMKMMVGTQDTADFLSKTAKEQCGQDLNVRPADAKTFGITLHHHITMYHIFII